MSARIIARGMTRAMLAVSMHGAAIRAQSAPAAAAAVQVKKVVGESFKLMLFSDGTVRGWGYMDEGQLGPVADIKAVRRVARTPVQIALPQPAIDIAAGSATSYAILADSTVVAWGASGNGALGTGSAVGLVGDANGRPIAEMPLPVPELRGVAQIGATGGGALALLSDGTVWAWGSRVNGMLGDGRGPHTYQDPIAPDVLRPQRVPNVSDVVQLSVGGGHVLALRRDGTVLAWGSNAGGALGRLPRQELPIDSASVVAGLRDVKQVAAGASVSTVLKKDGTVWVWGANLFGQFGNGDRTDPPGMTSGWDVTPRPVAGVTNVIAISLGLTGRHTLALKRDGSVVGWGNTDWGQIGAGVSGDFQEKPVLVRITRVTSILAAANPAFAVRQDATLWGWGSGGRDEWPFRVNTKVPTLVVP